jgi:hypothetical protein
MTDHYTDFPFEEIRRVSGDYFDTYAEVEALGYDADQIWSVIVTDNDDGGTTWTYGPPHHFVNLMGYIATAERHDNETYYHEVIEADEDEAADPAEDIEDLRNRVFQVLVEEINGMGVREYARGVVGSMDESDLAEYLASVEFDEDEDEDEG